MAKREPELRRLDPASFVREFVAQTEPPAPDAAGQEWTLVLFDRGQPEDARLGRALARAAQAHPDRVRVAAVQAQALVDHLRAWQDGRQAVDSLTFTRWPVAGLFHGGRMVTTFHPRLVFFPERLQEQEDASQLEIFIHKMVYYAPEAVKEQKNLELEARV